MLKKPCFFTPITLHLSPKKGAPVFYRKSQLVPDFECGVGRYGTLCSHRRWIVVQFERPETVPVPRGAREAGYALGMPITLTLASGLILAGLFEEAAQISVSARTR